MTKKQIRQKAVEYIKNQDDIEKDEIYGTQRENIYPIISNFLTSVLNIKEIEDEEIE